MRSVTQAQRCQVLARSVTVAGTFILISAAPRVIHAQRGDRPVHVDYAAGDASCPDETAFVAGLRGRSQRIAVVGSADKAPTLVVRFAARPGSYEGRITLRAEDGSQSDRVVGGDTCGEVAEALELIAAVAIDPLASTEPSPSPPPPRPPSSTEPASSAPSGPPSIAPVPPLAPPSAPTTSMGPPHSSAPRAVPAESSSSLPPAQERVGWHASAGAQATLVSGASSSALLGVTVFVEASRGSRSLFAPAVRLRFDRTGSGSVDASPGSAQFTWTAASLDLCPVAWPRTRLRLSPCARFEGGVLQSSGTNIAPARSDSAAWLAAGVVGRARWIVAGPVGLEAEGALRIPLLRDHFFFEPSRAIFDVPAVAWSLGGGASVSFW